MELTWVSILILICSGIIVGFINTLAGGGTVVSMSVFMFFGMSPLMANGTNRVAIIFQNTTAVAYFQKNKMIDWRFIFRLAAPITLGSIAGAIIASYLSNELFQYIFTGVIILFGISMVMNPDRFIHERTDLVNRRISIPQHLLYFVIGMYGGFVHVGIGYMFLAALVWINGYDILKANILKNVFVLFYVPFSLIVFAWHDHVCWSAGLIHAIGNIIGASIAARLAIKKGAPFIRYIVMVLVGIMILQLMGVI
jgi:uncharacterized membrane protein YfcA